MKNIFIRTTLIANFVAIFYNAIAQVSPSNPELIPFRTRNKWGYCNEKREIVIPCEFDSVAQYFFKRRAYVMLHGKFGYIDPKGKIVIPIEFDCAHDFNNRFQPIAGVTQNGKGITIGLEGMKFDGEMIVGCGGVITTVTDGPDGEIIRTSNGYGFGTNHYTKDPVANKKTQEFDTTIAPCYEKLVYTGIGLFLAKVNGKWGAINAKNEVVVPFVWDSIISDFYRSLTDFKGVIGRKNNLFCLLDIRGNIIVPLKYKQMILPQPYTNLIRPEEKIGPIKIQTQDGKWGYISQTGIEYFED